MSPRFFDHSIDFLGEPTFPASPQTKEAEENCKEGGRVGEVNRCGRGYSQIGHGFYFEARDNERTKENLTRRCYCGQQVVLRNNKPFEDAAQSLCERASR